MKLSELRKMVGRKSRAKSNAKRLGCESLEDRRMLTTFNFPADGTIDAIVAAANADTAGAPHIINLNADATAAGELVLNHDTTINGNNNTLTGSGSNRVLHFNNNDDATMTTNAVNDLTVTGGNTVTAPGPYGSYAGAGIRSAETLTITNSMITNNVGWVGGGISNAGGTMTIDNSTISMNEARGLLANATSSSGGGIFNGGDLTITDSSITGNSATHDDYANYASIGGGLTNFGNLTMTDSSITGNTAELGGGATLDNNSVTTFTNVDVDGNGYQGYTTGARPRGGGLYISGYYDGVGGDVELAQLTMTGGSVSNNFVRGYGTNIGGGMMIGPETDVTLDSTTISGNVTIGAGGGVYVNGFSDNARLSAKLTMTDVNLDNNSHPFSLNPAGSDGAGGASFAYGGGMLAGRGSDVVMTGGSISNNTIGASLDEEGNTRGAGVMAVVFKQLTVGLERTNSLVIDGVSISGNNSLDGNAFGGGLSASQGGNMIVRNSTISGNMAGGVDSAGAVQGVGAGIGHLFGSVLTVEDSHISGNTAGGDGGGIVTSIGAASYFASTQLNVDRTSIANNTSGFDGGAISSYDAVTDLQNATLSGNSAGNEGAIWHAGGSGGSLSLNHSTVTGNTGNTGGVASYGTGGIYSTEAANSITNSILSGNSGSDLMDPSNYTSVSYSLVEVDYAGGLVGGTNGNIIGSAATLATLASNGASTAAMTHALDAASLGVGTADAASTEALDGRGYGRPGTDGLRDMGAYEHDGTPLTTDPDGDGDYDCDDMDLVVMQSATGVVGYDPNGDGITDRLDILVAADLGEFRDGDANCSGGTDVQDLNQIISNNFQMTGKWTLGDFNGDGFTDTQDRNIWNANKFKFWGDALQAAPGESFAGGHAALNASGNQVSKATFELAQQKGLADLEFVAEGEVAASYSYTIDVDTPRVDSAASDLFVAQFEGSDLTEANEVNVKVDSATDIRFDIAVKAQEREEVAPNRLVTSAQANVDSVFADFDELM